MAMQADQAAIREEKRMDRARRKLRAAGVRYFSWFDRVEDLESGEVETEESYHRRILSRRVLGYVPRGHDPENQVELSGGWGFGT